MKRLVCVEKPEIYITAPDDMVNEVGGNCWQVNGPQPLTYPKGIWRLEDVNDFSFEGYVYPHGDVVSLKFPASKAGVKNGDLISVSIKNKGQ
jgi:hypothetical protein